MSTKEDYFPRLDPGESTLPRKRFMNLQMEANVYEPATNLMPLEPPPPLPEPAQPPNEPVISWLAGWLAPLAPRLGVGSSVVGSAMAPHFTPRIKIDNNLSKKVTSE